MNAAICSRLTGSPGQYSVAVQPSVAPRFLTHSTLWQNAMPTTVSSTSVKPPHGAATVVGLAAAAASATALAQSRRFTCKVLLLRKGPSGRFYSRTCARTPAGTRRIASQSSDATPSVGERRQRIGCRVVAVGVTTYARRLKPSGSGRRSQIERALQEHRHLRARH